MAGDWIKVEKATPLKPEVLAISEYLNIHPTHALGLCVRFWMWCDDQLHDGNAKSVTKVTLDFAIGHQGMTDALLKVDWLRDRSGSLEVPHFDRHLSEGSKTRALTKERVSRCKAKSNASSVTEVTQAALPEKRREEIQTDKGPPPDNLQSDDEWLALLQRNYPDRDVRGELTTFKDMCRKKGTSANRRGFVGWIRKASPEIKVNGTPQKKFSLTGGMI